MAFGYPCSTRIAFGYPCPARIPAFDVKHLCSPEGTFQKLAGWCKPPVRQPKNTPAPAGAADIGIKVVVLPFAIESFMQSGAPPGLGSLVMANRWLAHTG